MQGNNVANIECYTFRKNIKKNIKHTNMKSLKTFVSDFFWIVNNVEKASAIVWKNLSQCAIGRREADHRYTVLALGLVFPPSGGEGIWNRHRHYGTRTSGSGTRGKTEPRNKGNWAVTIGNWRAIMNQRTKKIWNRRRICRRQKKKGTKCSLNKKGGKRTRTTWNRRINMNKMR